MSNYDYMEALKEDIRDYIRENVDLSEYRGERDSLEDDLRDDLWEADSVTGNASGSYTFNRWTARDYVLDNMDLLEEALTEFCESDASIGRHFLDEDWEFFDTSIRCYLLSAALSDVLDELADELEEPEEPEDDSMYRGYYIDPDMVPGVYTVEYCGDEIAFDTIAEARAFIDSIAA